MKSIIFISGATASGKSDFVHKLIDKYFPKSSVLSVDSMQVYKYFDIGSAKPSKEEISRYRYEMIDLVEPAYNFSVKDYLNIVKDVIEDMDEPIFAVGGTGFYIDALKYGIFDEENNGYDVRRDLYKRLDSEGLDALYSELARVDRETARIIDKYNARRVVRALEVFYKTGKKFSDIKINRKPVIDFKYLAYVIDIEREVLYSNINARVETMFKNGLLDEVRGIINIGVNSNNTSMQAIGYKECYDYIVNKNMSIEELINLVQKRTRNFAKRQLTWFRRETSNYIKPDDNAIDLVAKEIELFYAQK